MIFRWNCPIISRPTLKGKGKRKSTTTCQHFSLSYTFVTRWLFCLRRFKKFCLCTASLVERTRLTEHKQSFLNLLRQNGCHVTKVYWPKFWYHELLVCIMITAWSHAISILTRFAVWANTDSVFVSEYWRWNAYAIHVSKCLLLPLACFQLYFFVISNRIPSYLSLTSGRLGQVISVLTSSQFNKTFTGVICKCSHCFRALSIGQNRPARPFLS